MQILTKRNGVALVAVLAVLLVLTLLLPLMFTYSENAMEKAMTGTEEQMSSYLARTMVEMSVSAFEDSYDEAEEAKAEGDTLDVSSDKFKADSAYYKMNQFLNVDEADGGKHLTVGDLYMYRKKDVEFKSIQELIDAGTVDSTGKSLAQQQNESDAEYRTRIEEYYKTYATQGIVYSTTLPSGYSKDDVRAGKIPYESQITVGDDTGYYIGYAKCSAVYDDSIDYYQTYLDPETGAYLTEEIKTGGAEIYADYVAQAKNAISSNDELDETTPQVFKVTNKNVEFTSFALVNGKGTTRRCVIVLPTKPSDENWIIPANIESNQIFPDTSLASSVKALKMNNSDYFVDGDAINGQPVYSFSCIGNMIISTKDIKYKQTDADDEIGTEVLPFGESMDYNEYIRKYNEKAEAKNKANAELNAANKAENEANKDTEGWVNKKTDYKTDFEQLVNRSSDFSLGLHPEATTIKPEKDPYFNCLKTNNMRSWSKGAQKDNFVAFTATNAIQIDMPVNLIMNPCRTGRIGDGISRNKSLYKILYLQAPTIIFNDTVNSFISLYTKTSAAALLFDYNAYRMSSVMLSAPQSTPYTYYNGERGKTVKAGKVYFADDAYIWLIPFKENGSNYRTQTVYYKGKDIILYKFANAGDVFMFNAEVETLINGKMENAGFSMTGYFMDIIYNKDTTDTNNTQWWQLWSGIQSMIFDSAVSGLRDKTYVAEDLKWIGNMNTGAQGSPNVDDFYVIWES